MSGKQNSPPNNFAVLNASEIIEIGNVTFLATESILNLLMKLLVMMVYWW